MNYVCIENNLVVSVLNYQPNVPSSVTVVEITDAQADGANGQEREFLNSTDWKVLRHLRQKALNITTSLSDAEYIQLEQQREAAAARIV